MCEQGTSADQDTRFSNKMKKLLKSQKFAPELDVLVRFVCPWWFHMFPCHLVLFVGSVFLFLLLFPVFLRAILAVVWQPSSWKFCGSGRGIYAQIMLVSQQALFSLMLLLAVSSSFQQGWREGEGFSKKRHDPHSVSLLQVDMTKVKVDVIRPWIATRVTELLGFEDEVLINFIYGMLDGKVWWQRM